MKEINFKHSKFHGMTGEEAYGKIIRRDRNARIGSIVAVIALGLVAVFLNNLFIAMGCIVFMLMAAWLSRSVRQTDINELLAVSAQDCDPELAASVWGQLSANARKQNMREAYGILQASNLATAGKFKEALAKLDDIDAAAATPQNRFANLTARFNATLYEKGAKAAKPILDEISSYRLEGKRAKSQNAQIDVMVANCTARYALAKHDLDTAEKEIGIFGEHVGTPGALVSFETMNGLLEEQRGNAEEAKGHFRRAVEHGGTMYDIKVSQKRLAKLESGDAAGTDAGAGAEAGAESAVEESAGK